MYLQLTKIKIILNAIRHLSTKLAYFSLPLLVLLGACRDHLQNKTDQPEKTLAIIKQADTLSAGEPKRMINVLDSLSRAFTSAGPGDRWKLYSVKSNKYIFNLNDTIEGRKIIDSMYAVMEGLSDVYPQNYAWTVYNHAALLLKQRRSAEAFDRFYEGLQFAQKHLDSCDVGAFYDALGRIKIKQFKFAEAIPYLKKAVDYQGTCRPSAKEPGRMPFTQSTISDIGNCYEQIGKLDSAAYYYQQALSILPKLAKEYGMKKGMMDYYRGEFLGMLGGIYAVTGKEKEAEKYLKISTSLTYQPTCGCSGSITSHNKLVKLYLHQKRIGDADIILQSIKENVERNVSLKQQLDEWLQFHELKWKYFHQNGKTAEAYKAMGLYYNLRDSIVDVRRELASIDLESRFRLRQQQQQLSLLEKDNQIKKISLYAAILFVTMAIVIIWLVIVSLKRSRKQVLELTNLNKQVYEQNENLRNTLQDLEQSQGENTQMLRIVAHDLRNPIGAITVLAELMLRTERNEDDKGMLNMIYESGNRSLVLVNDLLKTNAQKERLKKEAIDMQALLKYCVELLEIKAVEKKQHIELSATPVMVSCDREKLWRVISNLIGNAVKFSHSGTTIHVSLTQKQRHVLITVVDQGIGIPPEIQNKIFEVPSETKRIGTAGEATFGLGLAICKQIIEAHGGEIWFESIPGQHTSFFVKLPHN